MSDPFAVVDYMQNELRPSHWTDGRQYAMMLIAPHGHKPERVVDVAGSYEIQTLPELNTDVMKFTDQYVIRSELSELILGSNCSQHVEKSLFEAILMHTGVRRVLDSGADVYIHSTHSPCANASHRIASFEKGESQELFGNRVALTKSKQTFLAYDIIYNGGIEGNQENHSQNEYIIMKENLATIPKEKHFYVSSVHEADEFWNEIQQSIKEKKQELKARLNDRKSF